MQVSQRAVLETRRGALHMGHMGHVRTDLAWVADAALRWSAVRSPQACGAPRRACAAAIPHTRRRVSFIGRLQLVVKHVSGWAGEVGAGP